MTRLANLPRLAMLGPGVNGVIHMTDDWNWIPYAGAAVTATIVGRVFAAQLVVWRVSAASGFGVKAGFGLMTGASANEAAT